MKNLFYLLLLSGLVVSCNMNNATNSNSKSAANGQKFQRFYDEVMNAHNTAVLDSFCTPDFKDHQADPHYPAGLEGVRANFTDIFTAFPDLHMKTNFMITKGDTCIAYCTMTGTNSGPFMGMPAANKQINIDGIDIIVINNDMKAMERWGFFDNTKMMAQLGMGGPPAPADSTHK